MNLKIKEAQGASLILSSYGRIEMAETPIGISDDLRIKLHETLDGLSMSDFGHDFGKTYIYSLLNNVSLSTKLSNTQRAKNVAAIINEIAQNVKKATEAKQRVKVGTWNLYDHFNKDLRSTVFPKGKIGLELNEIDSLNSLLSADNKIIEIKKAFIERGQIDALPITIESPDGLINRKYTVKAARFKNNNQYRTLGEVFHEVTGVTNFGLMEDASHIPITKITTVNNTDPPKNNYNFYVIKSVENQSDSANKATSYEPDTVRIRKYFLKDTNTVNVYPAFETQGASGNNTSVYTGIQFSSRRNKDDEIDGTYTLEDGTKVEIPNLSESSKIAKTALKVMETYIDNYKEYRSSNNVKQKVCLHFPVKKFGDWCQSLCLLDTTRIYTDNANNTYTLKSIATDQGGGAVGILTQDQILVAYSFLLGVNIFYTVKVNGEEADEKSDLWLFYFKNMASDNAELKNSDAVREKLVALDKNLVAHQALIEAALVGAVTPITQGIEGDTLTDIEAYIEELRKRGRILSTISNESVGVLLTEARTMLVALNADRNPLERNYRVEMLEKRANTLISDNTYKINNGLTAEELEATKDLLTLIPTKTLLADTTAFQRFLSVVLYPIRDDFKNRGIVLPIIRNLPEIVIPMLFMSPRRGHTHPSIFESNKKKFIYTLNDVFSASNLARRVPRGRQQGGVLLRNTWEEQKAQLKTAFYKIRLRSILVVETKSDLRRMSGRLNTQRRCRTYLSNETKEKRLKMRIDATTPGPATRLFFGESKEDDADKVLKKVPESEYYIALIENYVIDRNGNYCSVIDNYIVTIDECETFVTVKDDACEVVNTSILQDRTRDEHERLEEMKRNLQMPQNSAYLIMNDYLYYRFLLLWHDVLYTKYMAVLYDKNLIEIDKLIVNIRGLEAKIQEENARRNVSLYQRSANVAGVVQRNGKLHYIRVFLNDIRAFIIKAYWNRDGGQPSLRERLLAYENTERDPVGQSDPQIQELIAEQNRDIKIAEDVAEVLIRKQACIIEGADGKNITPISERAANNAEPAPRAANNAPPAPGEPDYVSPPSSPRSTEGGRRSRRRRARKNKNSTRRR